MDRLFKTEYYTAKNRNDLARLIQLLKDYNYPLVELVDIMSIVLMLDYILSDDDLIEIYYDFINSSLDVIDYILSDNTYLKIEDKIIFLEDDFYRNICRNPIQFEAKFLKKLKELISFSNNP